MAETEWCCECSKVLAVTDDSAEKVAVILSGGEPAEHWCAVCNGWLCRGCKDNYKKHIELNPHDMAFGKPTGMVVRYGTNDVSTEYEKMPCGHWVRTEKDYVG